MGDVKLVRLGDVAEVVMGQSPAGEDCNRDGIGMPLLNGQTEFGSRSPIATQWTTAVTKVCLEGDTLFCVRGSTTGRMNIADQQYCIGRGLAAIRGEDISDSRYVNYLIDWHLTSLLMVVTGSTFPNLARNDLVNLQIEWPKKSERVAITSVLGALDDKISSNHRMGDLLIQLARTMLDTGEIEVRLGDIATCDKGLSYKGDGLEEDLSVGLPMVNLANFGVDGWLNPEKMKFYSGEYKERHLLRAGDLVVANTDLTQQRVIIGRPALVPPSLGKAIFTHHVTAIRPLKDEKLRLPIWAQLNSSAFRERAEGFATGTTVAGMPVETLLDFHVRIPDVGIISAAQELLERVWAAESESRFLKHAREILMPELLSGRLRVKDAESMMEKV